MVHMWPEDGMKSMNDALGLTVGFAEGAGGSMEKGD